MKTLSVGDALGRYELLCPIARGGMAQVWAARLRGTRGFQKVVAIKTILSNELEDARLERMFEQEAELASQIHHPNVAATLELGEDQGVLYLVMEWVNGEPLRYVLHEAAKRGGMPQTEAVQLVGQACRGLHAAHEALDQHGEPLGIVHRDVSPQNVLVTYSGTVKIVDFGVAKAGAGAELTEQGELKGKLAFMSPEQVEGEALDRRSDIFALGGILYWMLAGQHPFRADSHAATRDNIRSLVPPPPPSTLAPACSPALDRVVMRALEFRPEARFPTARELLEALVSAVPEAFDNDADLRLSQYMKQLFGNRALMRVQQLELSQQMVDRMRSGAGKSGSLPAVALAHPAAAERASTPPAAVENRAAAPVEARASTRSFASVWRGVVIAGTAFSLTLFGLWWSARVRTEHSGAPLRGEDLRAAAVLRATPSPALAPGPDRTLAPKAIVPAVVAPKPVAPKAVAPAVAAAEPVAPAVVAVEAVAPEAAAPVVMLDPIVSDTWGDAIATPLAQRARGKSTPIRRRARASAISGSTLEAPAAANERKTPKLDAWDLDSLGGRN